MEKFLSQRSYNEPAISIDPNNPSIVKGKALFPPQYTSNICDNKLCVQKIESDRVWLRVAALRPTNFHLLNLVILCLCADAMWSFCWMWILWVNRLIVDPFKLKNHANEYRFSRHEKNSWLFWYLINLIRLRNQSCETISTLNKTRWHKIRRAAKSFQISFSSYINPSPRRVDR